MPWTSFDHQPATRIVADLGAIDRVGELARQTGIASALLVTDPGVRRAGHADRALISLRQAGITVTLFDQVHENPTTHDVDRCVAFTRQLKIDGLIAVGGGSAIDTAKGCNFLLTNGGAMSDYWGWAKATGPMLPLIAAPTTAGTGSEVQSYALIVDPQSQRKMACGDPKAIARVAILDPQLTLTAPPRVTAIAGIDALTHAIESAVASNRGPVSAVYSHRAFALLSAALPRVLDHPNDLPARADVLNGACMAGLAIENSMLGAAHACANPLTIRFGVPHGAAVGVMLPHVIRFNAQLPDVAGVYGQLVDEWKSPTTRAPMAAAIPAVERLARFVESLSEHAGLSRSLAALGVAASDVTDLAHAATQEWTCRFNPRSLSIDDFADLYRAALMGDAAR